MDGFPDRAAVERAAKASDLGFIRMEGGIPDRQQWISVSASLIFDGDGPGYATSTYRRTKANCELRLTLGDRRSSAALVSGITVKLARRRHVVRQGLLVWDLGRNPSDRIEYSYAEPDRQVSVKRRLSRPERR